MKLPRGRPPLRSLSPPVAAGQTQVGPGQTLAWQGVLGDSVPHFLSLPYRGGPAAATNAKFSYAFSATRNHWNCSSRNAL